MTTPVMTQYNLGPVLPWTEEVANRIGPLFGIKTIGGWRQSDPFPDHPSGHALDFMVFEDTAKGDAIAQYLIDHADELGVKYIVWNRRSWNSSRRTWVPYSEPGQGPHTDHVHVTLYDKPGTTAFTIGTNASGSIGIPGTGFTIPNPFAAGATTADMLRPFGIAGINIISPNFWRRVGTGALGVGLIAFGLIYLNKRSIEGVYRTIGGAAASVGGTAIQGAAFGFGAGKAGGLGGGGTPTSSVPVTAPTRPGPRPPSMRPISATPVTSVLPEAYAPVSAGGTYTVTGVAKRPAAKLPDFGTSTPRGRKGKQPSITPPAFRQQPYGGQ
jgi:hypothetical protein